VGRCRWLVACSVPYESRGCSQLSTVALLCDGFLAEFRDAELRAWTRIVHLVIVVIIIIIIIIVFVITKPAPA